MKEIALPTTNFAENAVMTVSRVSAVSWCSARSIYRKGERRTMMKMENEILSPCDGQVTTIHVTQGTTVESGSLLCVIE